MLYFYQIHILYVIFCVKLIYSRFSIIGFSKKRYNKYEKVNVINKYIKTIVLELNLKFKNASTYFIKNEIILQCSKYILYEILLRKVMGLENHAVLFFQYKKTGRANTNVMEDKVK